MEDFKNVICTSSEVIEMTAVDFRDIESGVSAQKLKFRK